VTQFKRGGGGVGLRKNCERGRGFQKEERRNTRGAETRRKLTTDIEKGGRVVFLRVEEKKKGNFEAERRRRRPHSMRKDATTTLLIQT